MTDATLAVIELRMEVQRAEAKAAAMPPKANHNDYEDHRVEIVGELLGAMDRIEPGLGTRLQLAMYPRISKCWAGEMERRRAPPPESFGSRLLGEDMTFHFSGHAYSLFGFKEFTPGMRVNVRVPEVCALSLGPNVVEVEHIAAGSSVVLAAYLQPLAKAAS